ncbi:transposase [Acetobacter persici]|uniref:transposase n=1 Tax=Acetobacter persici TaxID=1076596 RepID=UPI0031455FF0
MGVEGRAPAYRGVIRRRRKREGEIGASGGGMRKLARQRKKVEMLFAHLKRILKIDRLRLRGSNGARDEFHLAAAAQNLRKMAKLIPPGAPALST